MPSEAEDFFLAFMWWIIYLKHHRASTSSGKTGQLSCRSRHWFFDPWWKRLGVFPSKSDFLLFSLQALLKSSKSWKFQPLHIKEMTQLCTKVNLFFLSYPFSHGDPSDLSRDPFGCVICGAGSLCYGGKIAWLSSKEQCCCFCLMCFCVGTKLLVFISACREIRGLKSVKHTVQKCCWTHVGPWTTIKYWCGFYDKMSTEKNEWLCQETCVSRGRNPTCASCLPQLPEVMYWHIFVS